VAALRFVAGEGAVEAVVERDELVAVAEAVVGGVEDMKTTTHQMKIMSPMVVGVELPGLLQWRINTLLEGRELWLKLFWDGGGPVVLKGW